MIVGTGLLFGWRLLFRHFATIEKCKGYSVPVLVWKISPQDEKSLDHSEGYPKFYTKKNLYVRVHSLDGKDLGVLDAMIYIMTPAAVNSRSIHPVPSKYYCSVLYEGYKTFGFDDRIFTEALVEAVRLTNPH